MGDGSGEMSCTSGSSKDHSMNSDMSDRGFNGRSYGQPNVLVKLGFKLNTQLPLKLTRMETYIFKHRVEDVAGSKHNTSWGSWHLLQ